MAFRFQPHWPHFVDLNALMPEPKDRIMETTIHSLLFFWIVAMSLCACQSNVEFQNQENQLVGLADSIEIDAQALVSIPAEDAANAFQWAQKNLREFELLLEDEDMTVTREEGAVISEVSRARRLLKDQSKRRKSLANSQKRTLLQLRGLAQALAHEATHDSQGTPIDSAYIAQNLSRELEMGRLLKNSINETRSYASRGIAIVEKIKPKSDSLQTSLRGRLARLILERGSVE